MVPMNIVRRTLFIKGKLYGTAFTLDVNNLQYLITAKHLLCNVGDRQELQIYRNNTWTSESASIVGRGLGEIDIAVLRLEARLPHDEFVVTPSFAELELGQDVYFLGFPFKMSMDYGDLMGGYPGPFVKKGNFSAVSFGDPKMFYIDAINNEGFSGGPLYFIPRGRPNEVHIAGVVSKYRTEPEPVLDDQGKMTNDH